MPCPIISKWETIFTGKCSFKKIHFFLGWWKLSYLVLHTETCPEFWTNIFAEIGITYYKCTQIIFQDKWKTKLHDQERKSRWDRWGRALGPHPVLTHFPLIQVGWRRTSNCICNYTETSQLSDVFISNDCWLLSTVACTKVLKFLHMPVYTRNPSMWKPEAGGWLRVWIFPGLLSEFQTSMRYTVNLSQKHNKIAKQTMENIKCKTIKDSEVLRGKIRPRHWSDSSLCEEGSNYQEEIFHCAVCIGVSWLF